MYCLILFILGDMKFLAMERGIQHANGSHPCVLCTMKQSDFWQWWLTPEAPSRSNEQAEECKEKKGMRDCALLFLSLMFLFVLS
jgi:hypothetical protein